MNKFLQGKPSDVGAYLWLGAQATVYFTLVFLGSRFGGYSVRLIDHGFLIAFLAVIPGLSLLALIGYQVFAKKSRFSFRASAILVLGMVASWFFLMLAVSAASAAV